MYLPGMKTIYTNSRGTSYRLEFSADLYHPFQLKSDWSKVMESSAMVEGTVRIVRVKPRKSIHDDTTRIMVCI